MVAASKSHRLSPPPCPPQEFGHNRTYALSTAAESDEQFCFVAFDCLFLDGQDLTAAPGPAAGGTPAVTMGDRQGGA